MIARAASAIAIAIGVVVNVVFWGGLSLIALLMLGLLLESAASVFAIFAGA